MAIPFLGLAVGAGVVAGACYLGAKIFNALSKREQRRQQELMDNHAAYRRESNNRYSEIHSQYASKAENMRGQALATMREMVACAIAEAREKNRPYYQKQMELCDEQLADVEESIAQCREMLTVMRESENKEGQLTPLRRNSLRQSRQNFEEAAAYYQSFANYLKRWRRRQVEEFERHGELIEPFALRLPEHVPYRGRIVHCRLSDLRQREFDLHVQVGITYPVVCEDVENLPIAVLRDGETDADTEQPTTDEIVPVLVTRTRKDIGKNGKTYTRYVLSYSKGRLMSLLQEHPDIALEATINRYEQNKKGQWKPILDYCGVEIKYSPSKGRQIRRKLPRGTRLKVYISNYNYNLSTVYASNKLESNFSPNIFHNIPLLFEEADITDFIERAKKLHLENSTEDWQIGPFEQDLEDGFRVKCQLGHRFVFVAKWRILPFGNDEYQQGLVFERMLESTDVFHLEDAYVLIDGDVHMRRLNSLATPDEDTQNWARISSDLYAYLYQEFLRQARIKAGNKEAIYFNHWVRLMNELCIEKEKGDKFTTHTFLVGVEPGAADKMCAVLVPPEEVYKYLARCDKWLEKQQERGMQRAAKKTEFFVLVQGTDGTTRRIDISFSNDYKEMYFRRDMISREELEVAGGELTVYLRDYPIPEYRQRNALEAFRLSDMTNPELKQLFFDLPNAEFSYNGRSHVRLENGSLCDNSRQMQAVIRSLSDDTLFFIQGPPGTGKTTVIREIILQELKFSAKAHILVVSQSNVAVDNVLRGFVGDERFDGKMVRCGNANSIADALRNYDFYESLRKYKEKVGENLKGDLQAYRLQWQKMIANQDEEELINEYLLSDFQIVGVTCVGLANQHFGLSKSNFDLVVIDEAGKAMPGELLLPINRAHKVIIIGDHKQLPPVVDPLLCNDDISLQSVEELSEEERSQFFGQSLFHRFYERTHPSRRVMLDIQFRMPPVIGDFISKYFYDNELKNAPLTEKKYPLFLKHNLVLIDVCRDKECYEEKTADKKGLVNYREADIVAQLVQRLRAYYCQRIVIITPYKRQKRIIGNKLTVFGEPKTMLNVDTVDSFQGDEAPVVIYCTTRTKYCTDFFSDYARINVAMSRTNNMLFIIASSDYLRKYTSKRPDHVLPALADYVKQNGMILRSADLWDDSLDWYYNSADIDRRTENSDEVASKTQRRYEVSEQEYKSYLPDIEIPYTDSQDEKTVACRKCGVVWPMDQLTDGICDLCLYYDGKAINCRACGKAIIFTNYERLVLKKKIPCYCEECAQLEKSYPCKECGREIHILPEQYRDIIGKGNQLPRLCRDCSDKLLNKYRCRQCGERIYRSANQVMEITASGKELNIYCRDCDKPVGKTYYCCDCGRSYQLKLQEQYVIQKRMKEIPGWKYPKRCLECRRKHFREKMKEKEYKDYLNRLKKEQGL